MSAQMVLAAEVMIAPSDMLLNLLLQPAEVVGQIVALPPANDAARPLRAQRDWWPEDSQAIDRTREKPRSTGLQLSELEISHALEREIRHLPVVTEYPDRDACRGGPRPCALVGCPANNYTSRTPRGALKLTWPNLEPWEVDPKLSCALDIADRGGAGVKTVAAALNLTEERIRQEQVAAFRKLRTTRVGREWLRSIRGG